MHTKTVDIYDVTVIAAFSILWNPPPHQGLEGFFWCKKEAGSEVSTAPFSFIY